MAYIAIGATFNLFFDNFVMNSESLPIHIFTI